MESSREESKNPLGLSLDFMFGRGYLWAQRQRISDWISLETLRMEIPDLKFPFDARTGLDRFRHTRCLVRDVEFAISEVGLGDLLTEAASHLEGFEELQVRFLEDAAHISLRLNAFGARSYLSFRAALIPPEPARADEVHLSLYDYRSFGPLPYPARLVAHELLTSLLNTPVLRASGRGKSFTLGIAGDIISFRPLKLLFLHIFPLEGWKLPDLSGVILESAQIRPGVLTIRAVDSDPGRGGREPVRDLRLATSTEGARALAAYEAKELFSHADQAIFEGQLRQALNLLASYRDIYGLHPELVARTLDCLLAEPGPGNQAEAEAIRRELAQDDPQDLQAALVGPLLAQARHRMDEILPAYEHLAEVLRERGQTRDWILAELALADHLKEEAPQEAVGRLKEVLKRDPRNQAVLERLRILYDRLGEKAGLEEILKRLTGVYTDRETLKTAYLQLARHLMDREGDLGEARMYLEKVLRLDPTELDALHTLGESYVLSGEPLRALKAFGSAARAAEGSKKPIQASSLHFRVAQIWRDELEDFRQALLSFRRAISLWQQEENLEELSRAKRLEQLRSAAALCEELDRDEEAHSYWSDVIRLIEGHLYGTPQSPARGSQDEAEEQKGERKLLVEAHRRLAFLYERRDRWPAAASHHRRVLEVVPGDEVALAWMEKYLRQAGRPEELIDLYRDLYDEVEDESLRQDLTIRLADLYRGMGLLEEAQDHYRRAIEAEPGRRDLRRILVEMLSEHRRFETLRDVLTSILVRTKDREGRFEIALEIGKANVELGQKDRAMRAFLEAIKLRPAERDVLEQAIAVLEEVVEERGAHGAAPVGGQTAGRMLENLLIRLAEVATSLSQERDALLRVAILAEERGDGAAAAEARNRARGLAPFEEGESQDVDRRLDAILDDLDVEFQVPEEREKKKEQPFSDPGEKTAEFDVQSRDEVSSKALQTAEKTEEGAQSVEISRRPEREQLAKFRERFQSMLKKPQALTNELPSKGPSPLEAVLGARDSEPEDLLGFANRGAPRDEPSTQRIPMFTSEELRQLSSAMDEEETTDPVFQSVDEKRETTKEIDALNQAQKSLERLRGQGSPGELVQAIEGVLRMAETPETGGVTGLDEGYLNELRKEAGELYYYELEDGEGALPHLEALRERDPDGLGAETGVVNALEAIYEESGEVKARIRLMEERLQAAQSPEMKTTYRLLLAQLIWDQQEDASGAQKWLQEVLSKEPENEAAHRLLADIAASAEEWARAAGHLEVVVKVAGGGLDAVESQRELADLYLRRLDDCEKARHHFEAVLQAAPGDSMALEAIKETQARSGDWAGYLESLGRELGLLIGKPMGVSREEMIELDSASIAPVLRVSASQIMADAAHIVEEELELYEEARALWGLTYRLWPEHVEALERRIALHRQCNAEEELAEDLESLAAMLLNNQSRFETLAEAAALRAGALDDPDGARELYAEAIALVQDESEPPPGLDAARRALKGLQAGDNWRRE